MPDAAGQRAAPTAALVSTKVQHIRVPRTFKPAQSWLQCPASHFTPKQALSRPAGFYELNCPPAVAEQIDKPLPFMPPKPEKLPLTGRPTTVLFDLDDTLFDHTATARAALRTTAAPLPFFPAIDFEGFYQLYSELLEEYHVQLLAGRYSYEEARNLRFQRLLASFWPAATAAEVEAFIRVNQGNYPRLRQPVTGARALLQALKPHYRIGIVTNNRTAEQVEKLEFLEMTDLVDVLITSEDVGTPKPDPRIFEVALQRLDARPEETVLVGDNWRADVLGALAVGIRPLWLNRFGTVRPLAHVEEITSLEPLAEVMRKIVGSSPSIAPSL